MRAEAQPVVNDAGGRERAGGGFYEALPRFRSFARLTDPAVYTALPDGWVLGLSDIVRSTAAIEAGRYKAVNTAAAAVIAAVANALGDEDFPFVFGGDGASIALPPDDADLGRAALAAAAAWVRDDLDLEMRIAAVPVEAVRAAGLDVRVARFAPSPDVSYAMFSGGGLAWAERQMKAGAFAIEPAPQGTRADLNGLSCRFAEIPAERGVILSLIAVPAPGAAASSFDRFVAEVLALAEAGAEVGRPVPAAGPELRWPPAGLALEAKASPLEPPLADRGPAMDRRQDARLARHLQDRPQRRVLRPGALSPAARREHRFPQVRRRAQDDARLQPGARRPHRGAASPPPRPPARRAAAPTVRAPR